MLTTTIKMQKEQLITDPESQMKNLTPGAVHGLFLDYCSGSQIWNVAKY